MLGAAAPEPALGASADPDPAVFEPAADPEPLTTEALPLPTGPDPPSGVDFLHATVAIVAIDAIIALVHTQVRNCMRAAYLREAGHVLTWQIMVREVLASALDPGGRIYALDNARLFVIED